MPGNVVLITNNKIKRHNKINGKNVKTLTLTDAARKKEKAVVTGYLYLLMFVFAVTTTMIGVLIPKVIEAYSIKLSEAGLISVFQSVGGFIALLFGGVIAERFQKSHIVFAVFAVFSAALYLVGRMPTYILLLSFFLVLGMAVSMLNLVLSAYISDLYPEKRGFYLSLLHSFFGLGSLLGPIYPTIMLGKGFAWNQTYSYLSVVSAIIILFFLVLIPLSGSKGDTAAAVAVRQEKVGYFTLLKDARMVIMCLVCILFVGQQGAINAWLPTFMAKVHHAGDSIIGFALTGFWTGIVAGRLIYPVLSNRLDNKKFILAGSLAGGAVLLLGILAGQMTVFMIAVVILGMLTGAIYPLTIGIACEWFPGNSATATSVVCLAGSVGGMLIPWLIGNIAEKLSFTVAMTVNGCILISVSALMLLLREKITKPESP